MGLSKTCKKCRECSFKDICNNKKIVAYAAAPISVSNIAQVSKPMLVKHTPIEINLGNNTKVQTSIEDIKKQMEKEFYKKLGLGIQDLGCK